MTRPHDEALVRDDLDARSSSRPVHDELVVEAVGVAIAAAHLEFSQDATIPHWANHLARAALSAMEAASEERFIDWLIETVHYPFDCAFDVRPPVDHRRLAVRWNELDGWQVTDEEAFLVVDSEVPVEQEAGPTDSQPVGQSIRRPDGQAGR